MPETNPLPPDETPIDFGNDLVAGPGGTFLHRDGRATGLQSDAIERELTRGLADVEDTTDYTLKQIGDEVEAEVKSIYEGNKRSMSRLYESLAGPIEESMADQHNAGINTAWGAGERAAELADPSMLSFVQRIVTSEGVAAANSPPPAPVFGPQLRGVEGSGGPAPLPPPPPPAITPPIGSPAYLEMMTAGLLPPPVYTPWNTPVVTDPNDTTPLPPPPPPPPESPPPPPPEPPPPPPPPPDPMGCYWEWGSGVWSGWQNGVAFPLVLSSRPDRNGQFIGERVYVPCVVQPPPAPLPPPPPPGVPPIPPDFTCPLYGVPEWNGTEWVCVYPAGGGGEGGGGGQCCPPTTIMSPPVVVNIPPPPPPPPPPPGAPRPTGVNQFQPGVTVPDWDDTRACNLTLRLTGDGGQNDPPDPVQGRLPKWLEVVTGAAVPALRFFGPIGETAAALASVVLPDSPAATEYSKQQLGVSVANSLFTSGMMVQCENANFAIGVAAKLGMVNWAETLTGMPLSYLATATQYQMQYACPQYLPGQAGVDELFLRNLITDQLWECWTKAQGNLPQSHRLLREAKESLPIDAEIIALFLRGLIPTEAQFLERMRAVGYVKPERALEKLKLAEFIPPYTDLLRMMIRDSADPEVVRQYRYAKDFEKKYAGKIPEWAASQGITEEVFRQIWYAHWDTPSNTQAYTAYHRLRPDRQELSDWAQAFVANGSDPRWAELNPRPPVVTLEDVKYLLEVNDLAPAWVDAMLAISHHPVTMTDARRAYMIGFKDRTWLAERMMDNGYDRPTADLLSRFYEAERERTITTQTGVMSARKVMAAYRAGEIDRPAADQLLTDIFPDPDVRTKQLNKADAEMVIDVTRHRMKAIKKRYVYGEIDENEASAQLTAVGVPPTQQGAVLARFEADKYGHRKEPRVTMLCQWFTNRIITEDQYYDRLLRLGYSNSDASNILASCAAAAANAAARKAIAAADRDRKIAKDNLAELRRQIAEREKALKELERRQKELEDREADASPG